MSRIRLALSAVAVSGFALALLSLPLSPARAAPAAPPVAVLDVLDVPTTTTAAINTTALTPSRAALAYRVTVAVMPGATDTVINVVETRSSLGASGYAFPLNSGTALGAGNLHTFSFGATSGSTYTFTATTASSRVKLLVEEIVDNHL